MNVLKYSNMLNCAQKFLNHFDIWVQIHVNIYTSSSSRLELINETIVYWMQILLIDYTFISIWNIYFETKIKFGSQDSVKCLWPKMALQLRVVQDVVGAYGDKWKGVCSPHPDSWTVSWMYIISLPLMRPLLLSK